MVTRTRRVPTPQRVLYPESDDFGPIRVRFVVPTSGMNDGTLMVVGAPTI